MADENEFTSFNDIMTPCQVRWKIFELYLGTSSIVDDLLCESSYVGIGETDYVWFSKKLYLVVHIYVQRIYGIYVVGGMWFMLSANDRYVGIW